MKSLWAFFITCCSLIALSSAPVVASPQSETNNDSSSYGFFYSNNAQTGIGPNGIIRLTNAGKHTSGYKITDDGEMIVPKTGTYLISYRTLVSAPASIAIYKNNKLINTSAYSTLAASNPIAGSTIIELHAKDRISLRSIENVKTINTLIPAGSIVPTLAVSLYIQLLND